MAEPTPTLGVSMRLSRAPLKATRVAGSGCGAVRYACARQLQDCIGTGSGYQAAVLAELCKKVYSIEYLQDVAEFGRNNLRAAGYPEARVALRVGDGYKGWPEAAPFDVILVTAAPDHVPKPLLEQLALNGKLIIPVGGESEVQELERWTRIGEGTGASAFRREKLMGVRFVPFLGDGAKGAR